MFDRSGAAFAPSSSLPSLGRVLNNTTQEIQRALQNIQTLYFPPIPRPLHFESSRSLPEHVLHDTSVPDSGYASEDDDDLDGQCGQLTEKMNHQAGADDDARTFDDVRSDTFERNFCIRWLTGFAARSDSWVYNISQDGDDEARAELVDLAASLLASFAREGEDEDDKEPLVRTFSFPAEAGKEMVDVEMEDAPLLSEDHTSVGLQSWASSIVLAERLCATPLHFGIRRDSGGAPRILELGAGTGLLSIVTSKILSSGDKLSPHVPRIIATDYHPSVLENLRRNVRNNFPVVSTSPVEVLPLDWENPDYSSPFDQPFDVILAADVVYHSEHARWIRDCVERLLDRPNGVFWLIIPVRSTGRHEGMGSTVEAVFPFIPRGNPSQSPLRLAIRDKVEVGRQEGVGRADESSYILFEIGWV
ncbi:hypothetical protein NLI96_g5553 [Meripilus lineatus]|uniref:S-adenosylmethionine-dependent methyltransferase n=1 Tax=Meripilus lineatus TaxID=2056292 RepID=A0AAD5V4M3_9APHY|nr:hypothetical protein NLI96_g5553 [Physisporinus lineatus]